MTQPIDNQQSELTDEEIAMSGIGILPFYGIDLSDYDVRACRVCGCTEDRACPGGCWWVEWDLCSACESATP